MRKTFSIILLIVLAVTLAGCGRRGETSGEGTLSDPIYEGLIPDTITTDKLVDSFAKHAKQFFMGKYSDMVYTKFFYGGDFEGLETIDGDMQITYLATDTSGVINSAIELITEYDKTNRHVTYYEENTSEKTGANTSPITSARYNEVVEKMKAYLGNLGISSGYIEMTEYALEGKWIINHFPSEGKYADVQLTIDSTTLELLEYKQNP